MEVNKFVALFVALLLIVILYGVLGTQTGTTSESDELRTIEYSTWNDTILSNVNSPQTLTQTPTTWTSATVKNQTWLEFDGVNDKVAVDENNNFSNDFSLSYWFKKPLDNQASEYMTCKRSGSARTFSVHSNSGNDVWFQAFHDLSDSNNYTESRWSNFLIADEWYNIIVEWNGSATLIYGNGALRDSDTAVNGISVANGDAELTFGNCQTTIINLFNGSMDDFKVYNRTLALWETKAIYNESVYNTNLGKRLTILSYHQIRDDVSVETTVNTTNFAEQMGYLNDTGFETITLTDYYNWVQGTYLIPDKAVIIMFDDGFANVFTNATPIMDSYGFKGIISLPTDTVGTGSGATRRMTWLEIQNLSDKNWEIVSHSINGTSLLSLGDIIEGFSESKNVIESNIGITPIAFVYPMNQHNSSIDTECSTHYDICTGSASGDASPLFVYKSTNLIGEIDRTVIDNITLIDDFKKVVYRDYGLAGQWRINENSGTTAYDSKNSNNGTITGATWNNDGSNTLTENIDYTRSGTTFTIINSDYTWSEVLTAYLYESSKETFGFHVTILRILTGFVGLAVLTFAVMILFIILKEVDVI